MGISNDAGPELHPLPCRLVIRREKGLSEVVQFVAGGLEIGQQVVVLAGPVCLKDMARRLSANGLRPESLLRSGRLVFLTAPNCIPDLSLARDPMQRCPVHLNGALIRWVSDWSWAYARVTEPALISQYQRRIHDFVHSISALSLCTVHCEKLERSSLLALLADHRRAVRAQAHLA